MLDVSELRDRLARERVSPSAYSIGEPVSDDTYCIVESAQSWVVFYLERGKRNDEHAFPTFPQAARLFLDWVLGDPTTRA